MPFEDNIEHRSKHVPWTTNSSADNDWWIGGVNWEAGDAVMTLCEPREGASKIVLTKQGPGAQGLSLFYDAAFVTPDGVAIGGTRIRPHIDEATFEAITWESEQTQPLALYYDLLVTPPGEAQQVFCYGTFTLYAGASD